MQPRQALTLTLTLTLALTLTLTLIRYRNLDKLIHYVNLNGSVNAFYSTPARYTDEKKKWQGKYEVGAAPHAPYPRAARPLSPSASRGTPLMSAAPCGPGAHRRYLAARRPSARVLVGVLHLPPGAQAAGALRDRPARRRG